MAITYTVGIGKDYSTIQSAINAVPSTLDDNYIIDIDPGTYNEGIGFSHSGGSFSITLAGELGNPSAVNLERTTAIINTSGIDNVIIQDLTINRTTFGSGTGSSPIFDNGADGTKIIQRCIIKHADGTGWTMELNRGGMTVQNCEIYGGFSVGAGNTRSVSLLNNTVVKNMVTEHGIVLCWGSGDLKTIKNNIFIRTTDGPFIDIWGGSPVLSNNSYYNSAYSLQWHYPDNTSYTTLASWQSAISSDANSITGDPGLTDWQNDDLTIASTSSAVYNTGVNTSLSEDIINTTRPLDSLYDIGAYEYNSEAQSPGPGPLLCWTATAQYSNGRVFQKTGPNKFPKDFKWPSNVTNKSVIEDGIKLV